MFTPNVRPDVVDFQMKTIWVRQGLNSHKSLQLSITRTVGRQEEHAEDSGKKLERTEENQRMRCHRPNERFRKVGVATTSNDTAEHRTGIWRPLMTQKEQFYKISRCRSQTEESEKCWNLSRQKTKVIKTSFYGDAQSRKHFFFFRIGDTWYRKTGLRYPAGEVSKEWGLSSEMRERMKNGYSYGKVWRKPCQWAAIKWRSWGKGSRQCEGWEGAWYKAALSSGSSAVTEIFYIYMVQ